ncbi:hypothetical protein DOTSEDRAFT_74325 [Dothistroma septosporum NZE10]|uniref:Uncharacterized protein n=1 Tax=Dothistroma septosporum (strain NZE10 / CBS 128990) TaxID=675120 RepID=N1PDS5_DOTSN|nr:hypothetical protein DOTSEDRAFT_74325 [Dothistroma septosporum NZE10]
MKASTVITSLAAASTAAAQSRPANESICDYYTTALLKENNATNQETLLTLVVNTAVIGNYTKPNVGIKVPGILAPGTGNYTGVNLLPYFNGGLVSTNDNGTAKSVNFLDDGGATPLMMNKPANGTSSAQYRLLTHLYQYFGGLLGCSQFANTTMQYQGETSQYSVHRFMDLDAAQVGWFIEQVGMSAASFGVADADVEAVGMALNKAFGYRCSPPAAIPATASPALQAICVASDCPIATANATCAAYSAEALPATATATASGSTASSTGTASGSGSASGSASGTPAQSTGGAGSLVIPAVGALALGLGVMAL